jgi:hypothetical protein
MNSPARMILRSSPAHHPEEFVFRVLMMPDEIAFELDDLDRLTVEVGDDLCVCRPGLQTGLLRRV